MAEAAATPPNARLDHFTPAQLVAWPHTTALLGRTYARAAGRAAAYARAALQGPGQHLTEHLPARPSWKCRACPAAWPCPPARKELARVMTGTQLSTFMAEMMHAAAADLGDDTTALELFTRFLAWTRQR